MPARSQAQRRWAFGVMGEKWSREHHFDNKGKLPEHVDKEIPPSAHYRKATVAGERCGTCSYFEDGKCRMYDDTPVARGYVCDHWDAIQKDDWSPQFLAEVPSEPWEPPPALTEMIQTLEPLMKAAKLNPLPPDSAAELQRWWLAHPAFRRECQNKYGYDPINQPDDYWPYGLAEPAHSNVLRAVQENGGNFTLELVKIWEREELGHVEKADIKAAGICVRARDTGRVLLLQRAASSKDPAGGSWEFPGGVLNPGEHPYVGAKREWQEEMGTRLPRGEHVGEWQSGVYQGFIHEIPSEGSLRLNLDPEDRRVMNPDDPDGDNPEVAAWFHPAQLRRMSSLRDELRNSRPWNRVAKAGGALYVVSHAKTRFNRPGQPHDKVHGWMNTPIDTTGRKQARALGKFLSNKGIEQLHSSDLPRAKQTAEVIGRMADCSVTNSRKYRPWNLGDFAGHSSAEVIPKLKPYMNAKSDQPVDGGESFDAFKGRFLPAFERLMKQAQAGKTVALVTHSRNIELIQGWLGGKGYRTKVDTKAISDDKLDPATVFEIAPTRGGKWTMKQLADEEISKDVAPGAPGDLPPTGDMGDFSSIPSSMTLSGIGPTISSVHVNQPLRNISINYAGKRKDLRVTKADKHRQLIYGVVLEPNVMDSQEDFMLPDHVEKAAHNYMKKVARGKATVSKLQHRRAGFHKDRASVVPVESFIAPVDFSYDGKEVVRKGTWVMVLHAEDPNVWQDVMDGKYTGLSIGGTGIRQEMTTPPKGWMVDQPAHWFSS